MATLAPNLDIFFTDKPYPERIARIADLGFHAADLFGVEDKPLGTIAQACRQHGVAIGMLVGSDIKRGLNDPALHAQIEQRVRQVAQAARIIGAAHIVVLSGDTRPSIPFAAQDQAIVDGLKRLSPIADEFRVNVVLEMLNSLYDHPGYYLDDTGRMFHIVRAVNHPRVKALYDLYHAGIMRGNLIEDVRAGVGLIGHFHLAGIPGRHEPMGGEQNYPVICRAIDAAGYTGFIGLEYWPALEDHAASLKQTKAWIEGLTLP